jgi:hypothetical protein
LEHNFRSSAYQVNQVSEAGLENYSYNPFLGLKVILF